MDTYNVLADALSTFRSVNDWVKALIVLGLFTPPSLLALAVLLRARPVERLPDDRIHVAPFASSVSDRPADPRAQAQVPARVTAARLTWEEHSPTR